MYMCRYVCHAVPEACLSCDCGHTQTKEEQAASERRVRIRSYQRAKTINDPKSI